MKQHQNVGEPLHKKGKEKQSNSLRPDDFWDLAEELPRLVGGTAEVRRPSPVRCSRRG